MIPYMREVKGRVCRLAVLCSTGRVVARVYFVRFAAFARDLPGAEFELSCARLQYESQYLGISASRDGGLERKTWGPVMQ